MLTPALRTIATLVALSLATCHAPAQTTRPSATEPESEPEAPEPARFDPASVRPDPGSELGLARAALEAGDAARALAVLEAVDDSNLSAALRWVKARAEREIGRPARSFETLAEVATSEHALAPWARLDRARMLLEVDAARAAEELEPLEGLEWPAAGEVAETRAIAWARAGDAERALPSLRALIEESPGHLARADLALPLADLLLAREDEASTLEAIGLLHRVQTLAPLSSAAREAGERLATALQSLPAELRRAQAEPSPAQALARAESIAAAMRHEEAEQAFAAAGRRSEDEALRCQARLGEGRAVYYRRERRRAAELLEAVATDCSAPDVRAWARYLAGKGFAMASDHGRALRNYERLEAEVPEHRLADDARFRAALLDADRGDDASLEARLNELPTLYPSGDMRGEARFLLAWRARAAGRMEDALAHLEASLEEGPLEHAEDIGGRAAYWRAVMLAELDRGDEANAAFSELARSRPLAYYALQSIARLNETSPALAEQARASWGRGAEEVDLSLAWRDELDEVGFRRALALLEVGEAARADRELLDWLGERPDEALRWLRLALLDHAGEHARAVGVARGPLRGFMESPPRGEHYARWRIAYPRAFADVIEAAAEEQGLPAALIFGIAREESAFRPEAVSVAHAYGLVQLILPTARRFGSRLDLRVTPTTLREPATNVRIGAAFMRWLWDRYPDNPYVLPSAYNAGQGATDRWVRAQPGARFDAWVEDIPYDETRRYTRRVLQSWAIYHWLDHGEALELPSALPRR